MLEISASGVNWTASPEARREAMLQEFYQTTQGVCLDAMAAHAASPYISVPNEFGR